MQTVNDVIATEGRHIIVETTRVLLKAGSTNLGSLHSKPLNMLLNSLVLENFRKLENYRYACAVNNQYKLIGEIFELLIVHGGNPRCSDDHSCEAMIVFIAANVARFREEFREDSEELHLPFVLDPYDEMMNSLGVIFRSLMLSGADTFTDGYWNGCLSSHKIYCHNARPSCSMYEFAMQFTYIAGYSSQPGASNKLLHMILSAMSTNCMSKLRCLMVEIKLTYTEDNSRIIRNSTDIAIEWVESVDRPFSLHDLVRRSINQAMSCRSLLVSSNLPIPALLKPYVFLNDN